MDSGSDQTREDEKGKKAENVWAKARNEPVAFFTSVLAIWPAPGSEDTELGVLMGPEGGHGETEVHARVQA
jgi:hypothetical protein